VGFLYWWQQTQLLAIVIERFFRLARRVGINSAILIKRATDDCDAKTHKHLAGAQTNYRSIVYFENHQSEVC